MIYKLINFLNTKNLKVFLISLLFHFSLYFSTSNKITFLLSIILLLVLYQYLKNIPLTIFYIFLIMLPFAKGKGIDMLILDKEYIKNGIFDIRYMFPVYFSSFYLGIFYIYYIRDKLFFKRKQVRLNQKTKVIISFFILFIAWASLKSISNIFYIPILLSTLQLIVLLLVFYIPFIIKSFKQKTNDMYMIIASSSLFQSTWLIFQTINKGYLGKDIEVHLPGIKFGIQSSENIELIRLPGTFFESSILGTFLLINLAILLFVLIDNRIKCQKQKIVITITILTMLIAIAFTGSRSIYFITGILLLYFVKKLKIFSSKKTSILKQLKNYKLLSIVFIIGIVLAMPYVISRVNSSYKVFSERGSGTYRIQLTEYSLKLAQQKPFFGVGLNLSPYYLSTSFTNEDYFVDPAYPHNIFIQLLAETGIIGMFFFLMFLYLVIKQIKNKKIKNKEFHLAVIIFIFSAQFYPIFINHMEIISYLFLYLGFAAFQNSRKKEIKNKKVTIVIPFTLPWNWSADFQRQTCLELARRDIGVFAYMNNDAYFFLKRRGGKYPKIKNVNFYIPKYYIPFRRIKLIESLNKYLSLLLFSLTILKNKKIIWIFDHQFYYFSKFFINKKSIYDCVDFFGKEYEKNENKLIKNSNVFFVNSHSLKKAHKNKKSVIHLVPQGFNKTEFEKNIKFLDRKRKGRKPVIGYVGGINYRINYNLLSTLIKNNPQWIFSFWGPIQTYPGENLKNILNQIDKLKKLPNTKFNITKNKLELMNAINNFDICIIPYDVEQKFNLFCYPMKIFEYFYIGKPIVSTPIKELQLAKFKNLIKIDNTAKGWQHHIDNLLSEPWSKQLKQRQHRLSIQNSWSNKINNILYILD